MTEAIQQRRSRTLAELQPHVERARSFSGWTFKDVKVRQAFNEWMRTAKEYDGFVDFDQVMRDPSHPAKMLEKYDSGDHLHPNDAGYQAMANAFNLAFVKESAKGSAGR